MGISLSLLAIAGRSSFWFNCRLGLSKLLTIKAANKGPQPQAWSIYSCHQCLPAPVESQTAHHSLPSLVKQPPRNDVFILAIWYSANTYQHLSNHIQLTSILVLFCYILVFCLFFSWSNKWKVRPFVFQLKFYLLFMRGHLTPMKLRDFIALV